MTANAVRPADSASDGALSHRQSWCLAVTETLAHLEVLAAAGRLRWRDSDGTAYYARV